MHLKYILLWLLFLLSACFINAQTKEKGITVKVSGINEIKGNLLIAFYSQKNDFLNEDKAVYSKIVKVNSKTMEANFTDIKKGRYAVVVIHDANANKILDTNFLGIPTEYIGNSNNIRNYFGPPSFDDSAFLFDGTHLSVNIELY